MDPEFGNWQAKELTSHLEHVFCNLPIDIVRTKKSLEVLPSQMKKVKLVKLLVKQLGKKFPIDFMMYIGDDHGIEPVFKDLNNKKQHHSKLLQGVSSSTDRLLRTHR
jgi:trehalose-6-phosphatase